MLSSSIKHTIGQAMSLARNRGHGYTTLEHLLLALVDDDDGLELLRACSIDIDLLRNDIESFFREYDDVLALSKQAEIKLTLAFQRVIQRAVNHIRSSSRSAVTGAHILISLFFERECHALYFLQKQNMSRLDALHYISHGKVPLDDDDDDADMMEVESQSTSDSKRHKHPKKTSDELGKWCINLNQKALDGMIDPLIGRDQEIERIIRIFCRRTKNNPILVGDPGVGKTAIAQGLALAIVQGDVPDKLRQAKIYSLDIGTLLAGTRYRGDFEERIKTIIKTLNQDNFPILFIDEIHTLIGSGGSSNGAVDGANLLKPGLDGNRLRCLGATTFKEYRTHLEKDPAFVRRFQKIVVDEPQTDDAIRILQGLKPAYESYHNVHYTDAAIKSAVKLSQRYLNDRRLPDKAIDLIDEAGAAHVTMDPSKRKKSILRRDIEKIISQTARIPDIQLRIDDRKKLQTLEDRLKQTIYGQDEALHTLASAVKLSRVNLRDKAKPVGCYLFAGPTGVGKTESSRQLAKHLGVELIRFDMSEYMEKHSISRLIGAPPGYVGFDQGGLLSDAIERSSHCVLLLDEMEKAHPDIFNILLQVMDYGLLTDHNGKKIHFQNTIIIMTTNAGAARLSKASVGFGDNDRHGDQDEDIDRTFPPEFRNRLDAVVHFAPLKHDTIAKVLDKELDLLRSQLSDHRVSLSLSNTAMNWLVKRGYSASYGARPLSRLIQDSIKKPLADELLFGRLSQGGHVFVDLDNDQPAFSYSDRQKEDGNRSPSKLELGLKKGEDEPSPPSKTGRKALEPA